MSKARLNRGRSASLLAVVLAACLTATGQEVTTETQPAERQTLFEAAMEAADAAEDRDSRVRHLRNALSYRPDHPDNLAIEYRIAVELSMRIDPEHNQGPRREEALPVFEHIVETYSHMDYYDVDPVNSSSCRQFMVPQAAIHAACLERGLHGNSDKAREYLVIAMKQFKQTYEKRREDWAKLKELPNADIVFGGGHGKAKLEARRAFRAERKAAAAEGEVFGPLEMASVKAAVRQYGYAHGRHTAAGVPGVMGEIVEMFPDTPMAKVAQEHIRRAMDILDRQTFEQLPAEIIKASEPETELTSGVAESGLSLPTGADGEPPVISGLGRAQKPGSPAEAVVVVRPRRSRCS